MLLLFENLTKDQADICALVLSASGIPYRIRKDRRGWGVWVADAFYKRAIGVMQDYFAENRVTEPVPEGPARVTPTIIVSGLAVALVLLLFHGVIGRTGNVDEIVDRFGASAFKITTGEVHRAATSLMLHADSVHLAGNMAGIVLFGIAVCAVTGGGLGWLMILMSGVFGNLVNAFMHESGHISIGASTAVFGAIGILSGYQFMKRRQTARNRFLAWLPLACGLALLGLLGSEGIRTDIGAHLFGFFAGIGMGLVYARLVRFPPGGSYQLLYAAVALLIIASAWAAGGIWH
jgi:rhomboid protease GluP